MKRRILIVLVFWGVVGLTVFAQNRTLRFIYITHDESTITQKLITELENYYNDAINYPDEISAVFYLSNGNNPVIVSVNTKGENTGDFGRIIRELQTKISHNIDIETDKYQIREIFNETESSDGTPLFSHIEWHWYINSAFWELGYNESLIAALSFILEIQNLVSMGYMDFNFYYEKDDKIPLDTLRPFGEKVLMDGIDCNLMPY